jgi:hypothetical protein
MMMMMMMHVRGKDDDDDDDDGRQRMLVGTSVAEVTMRRLRLRGSDDGCGGFG